MRRLVELALVLALVLALALPLALVVVVLAPASFRWTRQALCSLRCLPPLAPLPGSGNLSGLRVSDNSRPQSVRGSVLQVTRSCTLLLEKTER